MLKKIKIQVHVMWNILCKINLKNSLKNSSESNNVHRYIKYNL